jgi:hypothetical protein
MYNPNDIIRRRRTTNQNEEMPDYRINRNEEYVPDETLSLVPEGIRSSPSVFDLPTPPLSNTEYYDGTPPLPPLIQRIINHDWEPDSPRSLDTNVETIDKLE